MNADGSGAKIVALGTQCDVVVMPASGGQIINLTGDIDAYSWKLPLGWR
jgi:hypothetical protein